jgi:methionyl-tRNA formyltransferase
LGLTCSRPYIQRRLPIGPDETAGEVLRRLEPVYLESADEAIRLLETGGDTWTPQDETRATWFPRRTPADGRIDWNRSALEIHNWVRALSRPYPGAFTTLNGRHLFIWRTRFRSGTGTTPGSLIAPAQAATGNGVLEILEHQFEGGDPSTDPTHLPAGGRFED